MAEFSCRPRQVDGDGAAKRRRLRRLRSWWRHEQQTVAAVLATVTHHFFGKVGTASGVLRNMETATRTGNGEEYEAHYAAKFRKTPPQGGRPAPLPEVAGWQGRLEQHVLEDLGSICPSVQILDLPVLQVVEQPEEVDSFFRNFVPAVAEQVIEVPKLALPVCAVQRAALPEPQLVEQLVEVPTVLSYSLLKQRTAEQVVDTRGGLQGFSQGQDSTEVCGAENLVIPAPHGRGGGARGGLQGLSQGQGSTAVCGADKVVSPALHARGGGSRGGLQGLSQGQGSTAVCGADKVVSPALHARGGGSRGGLQGLSQGQGSTAVCGADNVVSPAPHGRGGSARGGLQGLSQGQGSSAVCGAENVDIPVPHGRVVEREVFTVFPEDRVPQRLPSSRLFLRLLIDRCHKPRFMADMTSGCAWLMWRTTTSTTGTGGTTLRAGGCRGESSTAGACSPLASTGMLCWGRSSGIFPLSEHIQLSSWPVWTRRTPMPFGDDTFPVPVHRQSGGHSCFMCMNLADPVSCRKYSGAFVFTAPLRSPP